MDKLKVFEAFSGYGSQSIALRNLGIPHEVVAISEIDKYAIKAYYALHDKNIPNLGDISKIKVEDIPEHDLFHIQPPLTTYGKPYTSHHIYLHLVDHFLFFLIQILL